MKFGLPPEIPSIVKEYDTRILADELIQVMDEPDVPWTVGIDPLGVELQAWPASIAKQMFLMRFYELTNG